MKRSFIREILEHTNSNTISFAGGLPSSDMFPNKQLKVSSNNVLNDISCLQYGNSMGLLQLREKIAQMYTKNGFKTNASNIMITSGSQQALDIISRYYANKTISIEEPSYLGAMNVFRLNNIRQESIKLYSDGCDIEQFTKSIKHTKLAYLIPDFQNPTSYTYSEDKRIKIANIINKTNAIIIEDSPYSDIYFDKKYESISSQIPNNSFHLGSFSKTLAPALRIGYIRANEKLLNPLIAYKEAMDLHTNGLSQYILNDYLEDENQFNSHKELLRVHYKEKMNIFTSHLDEILPEFEYIKPKGGMFIYGSFKNIDTSKLVQECLKQNVVFVPGNEFYNHNNNKNEIRFNFTSSSSKQINIGLNIIKKIISKK